MNCTAVSLCGRFSVLFIDRMYKFSLSDTRTVSLGPGEDVNGMSFHGVDEELLRRALGILEQQGKCTMFSGDHLEEDGIKFF